MYAGNDAYHVLHNVYPQRAGIICHWDPDAETNQHDYRRDTKDQHVFLAMSEKVLQSAGVLSSKGGRLLNQKAADKMAKTAIPTPVRASLGTYPVLMISVGRVGEHWLPLTKAYYHFHQS